MYAGYPASDGAIQNIANSRDLCCRRRCRHQHHGGQDRHLTLHLTHHFLQKQAIRVPTHTFSKSKSLNNCCPRLNHGSEANVLCALMHAKHKQVNRQPDGLVVKPHEDDHAVAQEVLQNALWAQEVEARAERTSPESMGRMKMWISQPTTYQHSVVASTTEGKLVSTLLLTCMCSADLERVEGIQGRQLEGQFAHQLGQIKVVGAAINRLVIRVRVILLCLQSLWNTCDNTQ